MNVNIFKSLSLVTALALAGSAAGCGTNAKTGNGAGGGIVIKAASSAAAPAGVAAKAASAKDSGTELDAGEDSAGVAFTVSAAEVVISQIDIDLPAGTTCADIGTVNAPVSCVDPEPTDTDGPRLVVTGPFVVDLMTGLSTPSLADLQLPPLVYNQIKIYFKDSIDDVEGEDEAAVAIINPTDPLLGHTLHAVGTFVYNTVTYSFDLYLDFSEEVSFDNAAGAAVDAATLNNLVVSFDVTSWFSDVNVGECMNSSEDDAFLIDGTNVTMGVGHDCGDISESIKNALEGSGGLSDDHGDSADASAASAAK